LTNLNSDRAWFLPFASPIPLFIMLHNVLGLFSDDVSKSL